MQEQEIIHYLRLLGEELEELGVRRPVRILMIGGAYMVTQFGSRADTKDVHENLKWLSVNIGDFMQIVGKVPRGRLWLEHAKLKVYVPDPEYVLVLKILAARDKDVADIQFLFQHLQITVWGQVERLLKKY